MMPLTDHLSAVKKATEVLAQLSEEKISEVLEALAQGILDEASTLLAANEKDLVKMDPQDPRYDRLKLTHERLQGIAGDIRNLVKLQSPVGEVLEEKTVPSGLHISKVRVPLGVVGVIYEARPNVTFDIFSLCFKTQNACVLKGGSDAHNSNVASVHLIHQILEKYGISPQVVHLLSGDRSEVQVLLQATGLVDVIIPRGSQSLIEFVRDNSRVPVIETGAGVVHTFFDESADLTMAQAIILNAKTRRPSVCNSLDTLLIHRSRLQDLPELVTPLLNQKIEVFADPESFEKLHDYYDSTLLHKAEQSHFGTEFLSLKMSIKTVANVEEAIAHINKYGSKHSEAILSENPPSIQAFLNKVDAAVVYANASTAFTDGAQFGMGAEVGISTQKLHARGPMALPELTSYKWIVRGNGQVRS